MTPGGMVELTPITEIAVILGADRPNRFGRTRAWYRDGDNRQAVSLDDQKQCWYDHRDQIGGGVLDLIQHVLGCSRGVAVRWLADLNGVKLEDSPFSASQRRNYARQRARAELLEHEASDFATGLELFLCRRRDRAAAAVEALLDLDIDPGDQLLNANHDLDMVRNADADSLTATYRAMPEAIRSRFRDAGRRDRENAEMVTRAMITALATTSGAREAA